MALKEGEKKVGEEEIAPLIAEGKGGERNDTKKLQKRKDVY